MKNKVRHSRRMRRKEQRRKFNSENPKPKVSHRFRFKEKNYRVNYPFGRRDKVRRISKI